MHTSPRTSLPRTAPGRAFSSCLSVLCLATTLAGGGEATIRVDAGKPVRDINPGMFGIFLEEINLGVDGGLYPEMLRNRGFEDAKPPEGFSRAPDGRWLNRGTPTGRLRLG